MWRDARGMVAESNPATAVDAVAEKSRGSGTTGDAPGAGNGESIEKEPRQRYSARIIGRQRGKAKKALKMAVGGKSCDYLDGVRKPR
jgi:hypothetical protein